MSDWIVRGPNQTGPWKGGYYISRPDAASACAFAQNESDAALIIRSVNAVPALVKALEDILEVEKEFRETMPRDWDGDPLSDACDEATKLLAAYQKDS